MSYVFTKQHCKFKSKKALILTTTQNNETRENGKRNRIRQSTLTHGRSLIS